MYSIGDYGDMIADTVRMDAFAYALKECVRPDSVVLDIGTGTGIHALLACKFGARKVYAIEPNYAVHLAEELAQENGFADRIEFLRGLSTHITLPEKADIIVSDLRGVVPLYAGNIPAIIDARQRHLAPGGLLIPKRDTVWVSLVESSEVYSELTIPWDYPYGMSMSKASKIILNDWSEEDTGSFGKRNLLTDPQVWTVLDYASIESPNVGSSSLVQKATRDGIAHGLLLWFDGEITDGIYIKNGPQESRVAKVYGCGFFPLLEPVAIDEGDKINLSIRAELTEGQYQWDWNTCIQSGGIPEAIKADFRQSTQSFSTLTSAKLHQQVLDFKPCCGEAGEIDRFILGQMDGRNTIDQIAKQARRTYPFRFETHSEAQIYVNDLSHEYSP